MKRILNFLCLSIALVSCGTVNNMSPCQENVTVSLKEDCVACNLHEKDFLIFRLEPLWSEDEPFPVITGRALENYNEWIAYIEDKPEYRNILSENEYMRWKRTVRYLIGRYSRKFDDLLFTVPGRVIAYTEKCTDVRKLYPRPDCAMYGYGVNTKRYRYLDFDYKPSNMENNPEKYIFRTFVKNHSKNMLVAIDRIFLKNSDKVLCLMYTCMGLFDYVYDKDHIYHYHGSTSWERFNPLKNLPMAFEFIYRHYDPVSIEVLKSLKAVR